MPLVVVFLQNVFYKEAKVRAPMSAQKHIFKTFPEFSTLTLADRDRYNDLIAGYPPISDYSFAALMTWWQHLDHATVSQLGNNLVIAYWIPGDPKGSGLSVVGDSHVDETISEVMDYLHDKGEPGRLVHVPEFTVSNMQYPDIYKFEAERDFDECVVNVSQFTQISKMLMHMRWKVRKTLAEIDEKEVEVKSIDLSAQKNKQQLLDAVRNWHKKGGVNSTSKHENDCLLESIIRSEELGLENACIFIKGQLHSFLMYDLSQQDQYAIVGYVRFSYEIPFIFEFGVHEYAKWFLSQGVKYVNLVEDGGQHIMRTTKLNMGPINFFRKYTITTRGEK